jgi:hypothetical protein
MSNEQQQVLNLAEFLVSKERNVVAITTPIPGKDGKLSKKTPVYHLPVYKVNFRFDDGNPVDFHCDLADITDLINKLKSYENNWRKSKT